MAEDIDLRTRQYIEVRDAIKRLDEKHMAERKPLLELQEVLAGRIQAFMDTNNIKEGLKTKAGTCYITTRYTASLADPDAFMKFVINTGKFELLDRRANSTAVRDYVEEHNELPTGCNLNALQTLGVRRPSGK